MQADGGMGKQRALQILAGEDESPRSNLQSNPSHFRCKMDQENQIKFNPWAIEKSSTQKNGSDPATIRSNNESEIVIAISNKKKSKNFPTIISLYSSQFQIRFEVEIFACNKIITF